MPNSVKLHVVTPSKLFYEGEVELVIVNTLTGEEGYMANHSWACKLLNAGALWIKEKDSKEFKGAAVSGGFVDVMEEIVIYTDAAEWHDEIDADRAEETKALAEQWLSEHTGPDEDPEEVKEAKDVIKRQEVRVKISKSGGSRRSR